MLNKITPEEYQLDLIKIICDEVMFEPAVIELSALRQLKFKEDLDGDTIDLICIYMLLEESYAIIIPDAEESEISVKINSENQDVTLGELIDYIISI